VKNCFNNRREDSDGGWKHLRTQSHAFAVLRPSSLRLLLFIEGEIARQGGGPVTLYIDQFAVVVRSGSFCPA